MNRKFVATVFALSAVAAVGAEIPLSIDAGYAGNGFYRYCPAVVVANGVRHVFYCRNNEANVVVDGIYHATLSASGELVGEKCVLSPADSTGTAWDSYHVCDPSVIAGKFWYDGRHYRYLMAYLGVKGKPGDTTSDGFKCVNNKVGLAVSDSLDDGWVRMGADCVVKTEHTDWWGVGQPSLVSLDNAGKVALFYAGDYETRMLALDFTDAAKTTASLTQKVGGEGTFVSTVGIGDLMGVQTSGFTITNGDFAWNGKTGCLYLSVDTPDQPNPWYDNGGYGLYITKAVTIYRAAIGELSSAGVASAKWAKVCRIRPNDLDADFKTAFRVHNSGLLRGPGGELAGKTTFVSVAHLEQNPLYTYRFMPVKWGEGRDWFDAGLGIPERAPWGGAWSPGVVTTNGELVLDDLDCDGASFQASVPQRIVRSGCIASVSADMTFEADCVLPPVDAEMKGAFAVWDGSYWGLGAADGGASNVWRRLSGKVPVLDEKVAVECKVFRVEDRDRVSYSVDGETLGVFDIILDDRAVSTAGFTGSGVVSSLTGVCDGDPSYGTLILLR